MYYLHFIVNHKNSWQKLICQSDLKKFRRTASRFSVGVIYNGTLIIHIKDLITAHTQRHGQITMKRNLDSSLIGW